MTWLNNSFYDNTAAEWLTALGVAIVVLIGLRVVLGAVVRRLASFVGATETRLDDVALNVVMSTRLLFLLIVTLLTATPQPTGHSSAEDPRGEG